MSSDSVGQSADLRTRIAAVLRSHWPGECTDTDEDESPIDHLADAVIAELGLQRRTGWTEDGHRKAHRYVTEWAADDQV